MKQVALNDKNSHLIMRIRAPFPSSSTKALTTIGSFPVGDKTLWKHLRAEGIIETSDTRARNTVQLRFNCFAGKNVDVRKIERKHFEIAE